MMSYLAALRSVLILFTPLQITQFALLNLSYTLQGPSIIIRFILSVRDMIPKKINGNP